MREPPKNWDSVPPAQWLCAAVDHFLGVKDLKHVDLLMSGFSCALDHKNISSFARAAFTLRQLGMDGTSRSKLRHLMESAIRREKNDAHKAGFREPPYELDVETLSFRLRDGHEEQARLMAETLDRGVPHKKLKRPTADPVRPFFFKGRNEEDIEINLPASLELPSPPKHDLDRRPRGDILIPIRELEELARELDRIDLSHPHRAPGNWSLRLREADGTPTFQVLAPKGSPAALVETDAIALSGLRHMIGLPGSGKTTLILLLLVWLDRKGYKTVVLLPSIRTADRMRADLEFYGCSAGLLSGQSKESRSRHALEIGKQIAIKNPPHGFGCGGAGSEYFAQNCALPAFSRDERAMVEGVFPEGDPPCQRLYQPNETGRREESLLCPMAGICGYQKAPRDLTSRNIWLGHIKSLDTRVPAHFSTHEIRYFEMIAMTSDVVIVDEADNAQAMLDRDSVLSMLLMGHERSLAYSYNEDIDRPLASGTMQITSDEQQDYSERFGGLKNIFSRLIHLIQSDYGKVRDIRKAGGGNPGIEGVLARFQNGFITSGRVLTELFSFEGPEGEADKERSRERASAVQELWETCANNALSRPSDQDTEASDIKKLRPDSIAHRGGYDTNLVSDCAVEITNLLRRVLNTPSASAREKLSRELLGVVSRLVPPKKNLSAEQVSVYFSFLVSVTLLVMNLKILMPLHQRMVMENIFKSGTRQDGPSRDLLRYTPESLAGRLAGIRFDVQERDNSVSIQHLSFQGAARMLLYRLHDLLRHDGVNQDRGGPNVLLASATSFLESSPTYHIHAGPDYVLKRTRPDQGWQGSRQIYHPIPDGDRYLRYSGGPREEGDASLKKMIEHFCAGPDPLIKRLADDFDQGRKSAIVVNSYDQARKAKDWISEFNPRWSARVIGVTNEPQNKNPDEWITTSLVETISAREQDWDVLILPMKALARGVNIVFQGDYRTRDAMLGTIVFLTRPHPAAESLDFPAGKAARDTLLFDQRIFSPDAQLEDMHRAWKKARRVLEPSLNILLRYPMRISLLSDELAKALVSDVMSDVLQTKGRGMRNDCKVQVLYVDSAWAPNSPDRRENRSSSMIVQMRDIMREAVNSDDPITREISQSIYLPYLDSLEKCKNVYFPDTEF